MTKSLSIRLKALTSVKNPLGDIDKKEAEEEKKTNEYLFYR
jgi:hypothetical protein